MRIIRKAKHKTTTWIGGTTTQLYIFPDGSDYQKRDFLFRISTATVEAEESTFTSLPGFRRKLMILEGSLLIKHKDHYEKRLNKFDQDEFEGGWETSAVGKVTDFNLMMAEGVRGDLEAIVLTKGEEKRVGGKQKVFIYVYRGSVKVKDNIAETGDLISFEGEVLLEATRNTELAIVSLT